MNFPVIATSPTETVVEYKTPEGRYMLDYHLTGGFSRGDNAVLLISGPVKLHADLKKLASEDHLQKSFMDFVYIRIEPILPEARWVHHVPNGGKRTSREGAKMKLLGVKRGVPDIVFPFVSPDNHPGLYIEFKELGESQSPEQLEFQEYAKGQGYIYHVAFTPLKAVYFMQDYTQISFTEHLQEN